jgi:hypothetical protein
MRIIALTLLLAACGEHGSSSGIDGKPLDGGLQPLPDAFDPCTGGDLFLTGELLDFDSSATSFVGLNGALLTLPGDPLVLHTTPPNGRLDSCIPGPDPIQLRYDAPGAFLDGSIVVVREARNSSHTISFRGITSTRAASFYAEHGLTFDATKAQLLVFMAGDPSSVSLDRPHGAALSGNESQGLPGTVVWSPGEGGRMILFPNVDATLSTGLLTGGSLPLAVPLAANELTLVAVSVIFI